MSFTSRPVPLETCSCGAHWLPLNGTVHSAERDREAFREAHAACRTAWQSCPVCAGRGTVPAGFYTGPWQTGTAREQCCTCTGSGLIPRPTSQAVVLEPTATKVDAADTEETDDRA